MLRPGVVLHVYGVTGAISPRALEGLDGLAGVIDDGGWSYLVFTRPADESLTGRGLEPSYQASLPYEQWLDGDLSAPIDLSGVVVVPPWCERPADAPRTLAIEPALAFGTGAHPTTRRCVAFIARLLGGPNPPRTVLDLGCGTGVLGLVALVLGAERVRGCDLSRHAVVVARANAARNGLSHRVRFIHCAASRLIEPADLVLANLPPAALDEVLTHPSLLASRWTIVSGLLAHSADRLRRELHPMMTLVEVEADGHWHTILVRGQGG